MLTKAGYGFELVSITRSFTFTGPDGVQYRWALGAMGLNYPKVSFVLHLTSIFANSGYGVGHC